MFNQNFTCPEGKNPEKENTCKGCRENGTLKNVCAGNCKAYKNYVKQNV